MPEITGIVIGAGRYPDGAKEIQIRGGHEDTYVQAAVMEASIKRYWLEANVINTYHLHRPLLANRKNPTPFSLVRHMVPSLCNFEGWGVYVDADQVVFADVREMLDAVKGDENILYRAESNGCTGVVLMNCEKLTNWDAWDVRDRVDAGTLDYSDAQRNMQCYGRIGDLGGEWNHHDAYKKGWTKLLHFTNLGKQPWKVPGVHPFEGEWAKALRYALDHKFLATEELDRNCLRVLENCEVPS